MPERDVVSWTAIIAAHSRHGVFIGALHFFAQMQQEGLMPNKVSYIGVLSACSHAGLVDECFHYYVSIKTDLDISPTADFGCLIDVLASRKTRRG
ncbi:hypothetical protein O6H91_Y070300 [Diphasiastrum complanatum]|nr:hypothetical protein O6H91_Y070300 [Diphasiastrum complanatum]